MPFNQKYFSFLIFVFFILFGCSETTEETKGEVEKSIPSHIKGQLDQSTLDMIQHVKRAVSQIDIENVPYILNSKKVEMMSRQLEGSSGIQRIGVMFTYGVELLNTGQTEESIATLNQVLTELDQAGLQSKEELVFMVKKQMAISYMRKAEQDNCIANHNEESCIIPISIKAQHILKEGAEQSIILLNEILVQNPDDLECQYLLNIAHMTLGQYPAKVPAKYRIPSSYFSGSAEFPKFKDIAMGLGIDDNQRAGGACVDDFNGDGYLDIIASSWGFDDQIKYFENNKDGGFVDKTMAAGLKGVTGGLNLRHADFDNDGYLDFIILRGAWLEKSGGIPNSLFRNNGDGTFTDVTIAAGVYSLNPTQTAVWSDVNLDGWVDLFIANESSQGKKNQCELFLNQTDGTFKNIAKEAGLTAVGFFKGVATGDINGDLYPDLYLSNYSGLNILYINTTDENGKPSFKKAGKEAGVANPYKSFPTWMFDYNNDGLEDIFVSSYSSTDQRPADLMIRNIKSNVNANRPLLYKNKGDGTFEEVSMNVGLTEPIATMGCNFGDLDNDGFLDFYLATGDPEYFSIVPNRMYHNKQGTGFEDVTYSAGFGHIQKGHAIGFGDIDMDGDQDIYAVMGGAFEGDIFRNLLFENPVGNENNWINIVLEGKGSNRSAIGAKVILTIEENSQKRKIYHSVGTDASFGGNSLMAEIGLGKAEIIKSLEIKWPHQNMNIDTFENVQINQIIKIIEGQLIEQLNLPATPFLKEKHAHHSM